MNRKERRNMEAKLGLTKYHSQKSFRKKIESLSENAGRGKEKEAKMNRVRELKNKELSEDEVSATISSLATTLTISEGLSWYAAMEKAKEIYKKEKGIA